MRKLINHRVAGALFVMLGAFSTQACDDKNNPLGANELLEQCGLVCPTNGIAQGNASISGVQNIDAFFGSVVSFNGKAELVAGNIQAELGKIAVSVGLPKGAAAAEIKAAIVAKFHLDAKAGIKIAYQPAKCDVSAKATIDATAKCDADFKPGKAEVKCQGSCEASASAEVKCEAGVKAKCVGTAPKFACSGECKGSCELKAAAACSGTCKGECDGNCSAKDAMGQCAGSCDGMCTGSCELAAAASCGGECKGECTYDAPAGGCEATATAKCQGTAKASVACDGKCEGEIEPPMAKAECQASAKAEAKVSVECTPPSIDLAYQFDAKLTAAAQADAQANFEAFLVGFKASFSAIVAQVSQAKVVLDAGAQLGADAEGAVQGAVEAIDVSGSLKVKIGVGCALLELPKVAAAIKSSTGKLTAQATAAGELTTAFGGK